MSSREQPSRLNFTTRRGRGSRLRPDYGNRFYFQGSRGRRGGSSTRPARNFPSEPDLKDGLDTTEIVDTITAPAHPAAPENFPINNVKYVASYNWTDAEKPTIIVPGAVLSFPYVFFSHLCSQFIPGSPAIWTGRVIPFTLQPDDTFVYVDQHNPELSQYSMLPLFAAADAIHGNEIAPPVDWPTVDVVTDRNVLRKLLRWLNPSTGREVRDFRIDVQLVGTKSLVLCRWESPTREVYPNRSFGHAFEVAMTRAARDCPSSGHHRAITYVRCHHFPFL